MSAAPESPIHALHVGTAGWSYPDWVGPFYPDGTKREGMFAHYTQRYTAVELDSSFYGVPRATAIASWRDRAPTGFLLCPKFPKEISHDSFLEGCEAVHETFCARFAELGEHLGPMLLQFPYFRKASGVDVSELMRRLEPFLKRHREMTRARLVVEVRNKAFLIDDFRALLESHDAVLAAIDHPWMPDPEEILTHDSAEAGARRFSYLRMLGDRKGIERVTKKWTREVLDPSWRVSIWVRWILSMRTRGDVFVFVNNHYAGFAPATVERIERGLAAS